MQNTFYLLLVLLTFSFSLLPSKVSAHILETDGSIGAVLHVDPEDDPIVGQPASLFFEFKDKKNVFQPAECNCIVTIKQSGKEIFSQSLFQNSTDAQVLFTFPEKDVYSIVVTGEPVSPELFQSFVLKYDIRISREGDTISGNQVFDGLFQKYKVYILGGVAVLIFILFFTKRFIKK